MKFSQLLSLAEEVRDPLIVEYVDNFMEDEEAKGKAAGELYANLTKLALDISNGRLKESDAAGQLAAELLVRVTNNVPPFLKGFLSSTEVPSLLGEAAGILFGNKL